jgi:tetratricopeptide (TPR) repeat protein
MLTGEKVFPHLNLSDLFEAKTKNEFVPLHLFNIPIPKRLKKLVNSCIAYDPANRPQSASALLDELESIHYSTSEEKCETALNFFLQSSDKDRTIHFARKNHFIPSMIWGGAAIIAITAIAVVTVVLKRPAYTPVKPSTPQVQPMTLPASPALHSGAAPVASAKTARTSKTNKKTDRAAIAPPREHRSYLDETKARLHLSDPLDVLAKEAEAGKYESVLMIFSDLPPDAAADPVALLFRLRSLYALGKMQQVAEILNGPSAINDGEFYLIKAKVSCGQGKIDQSLLLLDKALEIKARNLNAEALRRDCLFVQAQCMSRRFDTTPTDANRKDALDSWFEVKNTIRNNPGHEYYKKAVSEMQRIGEISVHDKG